VSRDRSAAAESFPGSLGSSGGEPFYSTMDYQMPRDGDTKFNRPGCRYEVFWRQTQPVIKAVPLSADLTCDICIIGAGYTGLWSAYFLKKADPMLRIHILEAEYAGAGASGHNDGFVTKAVGGHSVGSIAHQFGMDSSMGVHAAVTRSAVAIIRFCDLYGINADIELAGFYIVATSHGQRSRLERDVALASSLSSPSSQRPRLLDAAQIRQRIACPNIMAGVWNGGFLINPHKLARGLACVVQAQGTQIHEQTPVIGFEEDRHAVRVRTAGACVRTRRLIVATDAWQAQFPQFRRSVLPTWNYVLVTASLTEEQLREVGWPAREGFVEAGRPGYFGRLTADNRILFGGGSTYQPARLNHGPKSFDAYRPNSWGSRAERRLCAAFSKYFPMIPGTEITHFYRGAIGLTRERLPRVGNFSPLITYGYGYSGNGIAASHTLSQLIRDAVLGLESPDWANVFRIPIQAFWPMPLSLLSFESRKIFGQLASR
jgi:glycine/D-amino acid oxidase-like deaminating enzyme